MIKRAKDITTYKAPSKNELSNKIAELSKANDITDKNENTIGKGLSSNSVLSGDLSGICQISDLTNNFLIFQLINPLCQMSDCQKKVLNPVRVFIIFFLTKH